MGSVGELKETDLRTWLSVPYGQAIERAREALQAEGFGILTEIDVKATLKKKLDADFRRYCILGACNPPLAHRAFQAELEIGLLLPCNVIVYEEGQGSVVSVMDPGLMNKMVDNPGLVSLAQEARARLERVVASLRKGG